MPTIPLMGRFGVELQVSGFEEVENLPTGESLVLFVENIVDKAPTISALHKQN